MIFSKKIKLFTVFILVKIFFTAFSLFIFHNFSPLIDAHLYQSEYYDIATKDLSIKISLRTYFIQSIVIIINSILPSLTSHFLFSIFSIIGILWLILYRNTSWLVLIVLLFPSAMIWTSVIGKESIYYLCFSTILIIWSIYVNNTLSNAKIIILIVCTLTCFLLRPHYAICIPFLFASSYILKKYYHHRLLFFIYYSLILFLSFFIIFYFLDQFTLKWTAYSSIDIDGNSSRHAALGFDKVITDNIGKRREYRKQNLMEHFDKYFMTGFIFGIIGPFFSELISRPIFIPFFIEGLTLLLSPILFLSILFYKKFINFKNIYFLNYIFVILPTIILLMCVHAYWGILNPGSAIRWRINFKLIFYFAPLLLFLNMLNFKKNNS